MFGLTTTRRLRAEVAAAKAEADRQRDHAERAEGRATTAEYNRSQALHQLAEADAANRRLHDRNLELGRRNSKLTEADPEYAATLEQRVTDLTAQLDESTTKVKNLRSQLFAWEARARTVDPEQAWLARPVDGAPERRDESAEARVRRAQEHSSALAGRLAELTVANQKCTCQRPLAKTGGAV
jgi:chromosome segregation ATPase